MRVVGIDTISKRRERWHSSKVIKCGIAFIPFLLERGSYRERTFPYSSL